MHGGRLFRASRPDDARDINLLPQYMVGVPQVSAVGMCSRSYYWTEWVYNHIWDPRVVGELVQRRYNILTHIETQFQQFISTQHLMIELSQKSQAVQALPSLDDVSVLTCVVCTDEMSDDDLRLTICRSENCSTLVCRTCLAQLLKCPTCRKAYSVPPYPIKSDSELRKFKLTLVESSKMCPTKPAVEPTIELQCRAEFDAFVPAALADDVLKAYFSGVHCLVEQIKVYNRLAPLFEKSTIEQNDRYRQLQHTFSQLDRPGSTYDENSFQQRSTRLTRSQMVGGVNHQAKLDELREYFLNAHSERYTIMTNVGLIKRKIVYTLHHIKLLREIDERIPGIATFCRFGYEIVKSSSKAFLEMTDKRKRERELNHLSCDLKIVEREHKRACIQRGEGGSWVRET